MIKNPHGRILRGKPKEQHLSTVPKFYPYTYIHTYIHTHTYIYIYIYMYIKI